MVKLDTKLTNPAWETDAYYKSARHAICFSKSHNQDILCQLGRQAEKILDIGCGEGSRLFLVAGNNKGVGADISLKALSLAKREYPQYLFKKADVVKHLPFKKESFNLVYSAFVLEHVNNPEQLVREAIRVLKRGGILCLIAPNYGAPNRASPVFRGSRLKKFLRKTVLDIFPKDPSSLNWDRVIPVTDKYEQDLDTTIEPYAGSLHRFLLYLGLSGVECNTTWDEELPGAKIHQKIFRILGNLNIYPFEFWGPQIFLIAKKTK